MGRTLTRLEFRALEAIADALVPEGGAIPQSASELNLAADIDDMLSRFSPTARRLVRAMIAGVEVAPLLSAHPRLLHSMSPDARDQWLASNRKGRKARAIKEALGGVRTLVAIAYASHPDISAAIGYREEPLLPLDWSTVPAAVNLDVVQYPDVRSQTIDADVAIIGTGAGGAVAAETLARAGLRVVLLEEGGAYNRENFRGRRAIDRAIDLYRDQAMTGTIGAPAIQLPLGRVVGGTTVVNSGTCHRTPAGVLDEWSKSGLPDVTPEDMEPWFDVVEDVIGVQPIPDGAAGMNAEVLRRGAAELGLSGGPIRRNARGCHGHGPCNFGCPVDAKQAMHVSYLPRAVANGAVIYAHVRARKVWIENERAVGVIAEVRDPDTDKRRGTLRVRARATVVAAGAVHTPALLLRQGIADSSGQLGRNFVIHPGAGVTALFDEDLRAWRGAVQGYFVDHKIDEGILLESTFPPPGITYSASSIPGTGAEYKELFAQYPNMASVGSIISDGPNGHIRPLGNQALMRYNLSREDTAKVVEAIAFTSDIFFAAGARTVFPMLPGLPTIHSREDVSKIREGHWRRSDLKLSAYHPMGTARAGADPRTSVTDPWGKVWDVPGLWILDGSIMPSSTRVNPQVTIMAMVARNAARLADSLT
ncbi:MAG: GMC family oxidoreductase N-terminal domain-containing protein [Actinomycetota bacterium]